MIVISGAIVCQCPPPEIPPTPWLSKRIDIYMQQAMRDVRDNCRIAELNRRIENHGANQLAQPLPMK